MRPTKSDHIKRLIKAIDNIKGDYIKQLSLYYLCLSLECTDGRGNCREFDGILGTVHDKDQLKKLCILQMDDHFLQGHLLSPKHKTFSHFHGTKQLMGLGRTSSK